MIKKTEKFLSETFASSKYLQNNPADRDYRIEHSYRVANIAKNIANAEGFNETYAVIAGLLHDISYCEEMITREDRLNHGRRSAQIARPFLESLGLPTDAVNEICYGIAIHVDDHADFEWVPRFVKPLEMQIILTVSTLTEFMKLSNILNSVK